MLLIFTACDDYDSFTTDRSKTLSFSRDTIVFDTLLTTIPSSTQTLTIFNHADKGLHITDVWLEGGATSPFRINIDGQDMSRSSENHVTDFEVRRRDSLVIRAEVTLPEFGFDDPREVKDVLVFVLESGIQQRVPLTVVGRDAFFLRARTFFNDTTLRAQRPIVIYDSLVVSERATLILEAGTQLLFHENAKLIVQGCLIAQGTLEAPVVFRGDRMDHMFDYLPYDRLPARWEGVSIKATSFGNDLNYVDLHSGNYGLQCDSTGVDCLKLTLTNCRIHNLGGHGLEATACQVQVFNTEISNTLGHCLKLLGGDATFLHCTFAQFYALDANRGNAVDIGVTEDSLTFYPLHQALFRNCVITGYADDVMLLPPLSTDGWPSDIADKTVNYQFNNCFMAMEIPQESDYLPHFVDCLYDNPKSDYRHDKNFQLLDTHLFLYDFTPVEQSPIRGMANPAYSVALPLDRMGRSRTADGAPDAGCYEFMPSSMKEQ